MKTVLMIAGTDPLEGAGVIADGRVAAVHGAFSITLETALVDQDTLGVHGFESASPGGFARRLRRILENGGVDAVKIGMTGSPALVEVIAQELARWRSEVGGPVVLDPVLASGAADGASLARGEMAQALRSLLPLTTIVTPNARELAVLSAAVDVAESHDQASEQARSLLDAGAESVLVKGGHLEPQGVDWLVREGSRVVVHAGAPWGVDVHGTGCHLSTAIACRLVRGESLEAACRGASRWLHGLVHAGALVRRGPGRPQFDPRRLGDGLAL